MNPLKILNLNPGDTLEDAKKNYRILSLKHHPDKNPDDPSSISVFRKISESYEIIKSNPHLLNPVPKIYNPQRHAGYLIAEATVDLADVYLKTLQYLFISRKRICRTCGGSGSSEGLCELCKGQGQVKNKVSSLIGLGDTCHACKGTGVKDAPACPDCKGTGTKEEPFTIKFIVNKKQFNKKLVVVNGVGDEYKKDLLTSVHIKLRTTYSNRVILEGETYKMSYGITPAQYVLGDKVRINLFGKAIIMTIPKESNETIIRDKRKDGMIREIEVDLLLSRKPLTYEVQKLYEEILRLEKSSG